MVLNYLEDFMSSLERLLIRWVGLLPGLRRISWILTTVHRWCVGRSGLELGFPGSGSVRRGILRSGLRSGLSRQDHGRVHGRSLVGCGRSSGGGHRHAC
jgi:hypothetical protein